MYFWNVLPEAVRWWRRVHLLRGWRRLVRRRQRLLWRDGDDVRQRERRDIQVLPAFDRHLLRDCGRVLSPYPRDTRSASLRRSSLWVVLDYRVEPEPEPDVRLLLGARYRRRYMLRGPWTVLLHIFRWRLKCMPRSSLRANRRRDGIESHALHVRSSMRFGNLLPRRRPR